MTSLFGLPAHPLFAHIPVVLVPLAAIGAVMMWWPNLRARIGWFVLAILVVAGVATQFAVSSGQSLKEYVKETPLMRQHTHMGENLRPWLLLMFLALLGVMLVDRAIKKREADGAESSGSGAGGRDTLKIASVSLLALAMVFTALSVYWVFEIGHSGSKAVWQPTQTKIDKGQREPKQESRNEGSGG